MPNTNLFEGVSVFVAGHTIPSYIELKRLVRDNGGICRHYFKKSKVTHVIASAVPSSKAKDIHPTPIVHPSWIIDSLIFINFCL